MKPVSFRRDRIKDARPASGRANCANAELPQVPRKTGRASALHTHSGLIGLETARARQTSFGGQPNAVALPALFSLGRNGASGSDAPFAGSKDR